MVGGAVVVTGGGGAADRVGNVTEGSVGRPAVDSSAVVAAGVDSVGSPVPGRSDGSETSATPTAAAESDAEKHRSAHHTKHPGPLRRHEA